MTSDQKEALKKAMKNMNEKELVLNLFGKGIDPNITQLNVLVWVFLANNNLQENQG